MTRRTLAWTRPARGGSGAPKRFFQECRALTLTGWDGPDKLNNHTSVLNGISRMGLRVILPGFDLRGVVVVVFVMMTSPCVVLRRTGEGPSLSARIRHKTEDVLFLWTAPPDAMPGILLGRLAIDRSRQGEGLGRAPVRDAILRTVQAADIGGIRALLVHAKSDQAPLFYERCGFMPSPVDPMTLMVTILDALKAVQDCG